MAVKAKQAKAPGSRGAWYAGGLCFECLPDCGACCTNHGRYSFVYLERDDLERIASFLRLPPGEFEARHTTVEDGDRVLSMDEPDCPFLEGKRCSIYPVRPIQCRTFPFWTENLQSRAGWNRLAEFCPGINSGKLHPLHVIRRELDLRENG